MKVYTQFSAMHEDFPKEINTKISQTIPEQATSPQELLRRYATGQPLGFKSVQPVYDDDESNPIPEFYKMDKLDRLHDLQTSTDNLVEKRNDYDQFLNKQKIKEAQKASKIKQEKDNNAKSEQQAKRSEAQSEQTA